MKKFLKTNWFKIAILVILVLMGIALIITLTIKTGQPVASSQKIESCSDQAQTLLSNEKGGNSSQSTFSQESHYNTSLNKCFVKLTEYLADPSNGDIVTIISLRDGYENKTFISCASNSKSQTCFVPAAISKTGAVQPVGWDDAMRIMETYMKN